MKKKDPARQGQEETLGAKIRRSESILMTLLMTCIISITISKLLIMKIQLNPQDKITAKNNRSLWWKALSDQSCRNKCQNPKKEKASSDRAWIMSMNSRTFSAIKTPIDKSTDQDKTVLSTYFSRRTASVRVQKVLRITWNNKPLLYTTLSNTMNLHKLVVWNKIAHPVKWRMINLKVCKPKLHKWENWFLNLLKKRMAWKSW